MCRDLDPEVRSVVISFYQSTRGHGKPVMIANGGWQRIDNNLVNPVWDGYVSSGFDLIRYRTPSSSFPFPFSEPCSGPGAGPGQRRNLYCMQPRVRDGMEPACSMVKELARLLMDINCVVSIMPW